MKFTRTISLILALCMVMSVLATGMFTASAAESEDKAPVEVAAKNYDDMWLPRVGDSECTATQLETFKLATEGLYSNYVVLPMQVIATKAGTSGIDMAYLTYFSYSKKTFDMFSRNGWSDTELLYNGYWWMIITVHLTYKNNVASWNSQYKIDLDNIETIKDGPKEHLWKCLGQEPSEEINKELEMGINLALSNDTDMIFSVCELLGTKEKKGAGKDCRTLCYGTPKSDNTKTDLYIIDVHLEEENPEVLSMEVFDLDKYAYFRDDTEEEVEGTETSDNSETATEDNKGVATNTDATSNTQKDSNNSSNAQNTGSTSTSTTSTGSSASATSPKTGQEDTIVFVMLGVMILASAVIFFVRKRERT